MAAPGPPARRCIRRVYLSLHLLQPSARSHTPGSTLLRDGVEEALKLLEGRWKLVILFHLFGAGVLRFSDLERATPAVSQKMLIPQLRQMEQDGIGHTRKS